MATYESHPANGPILFCFAGVCGHEEQNGEILPQQTEKERLCHNKWLIFDEK